MGTAGTFNVTGLNASGPEYGTPGAKLVIGGAPFVG